jgi:hypothetical protein
VAVGEVGDADDGPGAQGAAADRGGDQRVAQRGPLVSDDGGLPAEAA